MRWLDQVSESVAAEQTASSLILFCYLLSFMTHKRGCFLAAFIFTEFIAASNLLNSYSEPDYWVVLSTIYCSLYVYIFLTKGIELKELSCCVIIVLFDIGMSIDAWHYGEIESFLYKNYVAFFMAIHLYFIYSTTNWKKLQRIGKAVAGVFRSRLGVDYYLSFFSYNADIYNQKLERKW